MYGTGLVKPVGRSPSRTVGIDGLLAHAGIVARAGEAAEPLQASTVFSARLCEQHVHSASRLSGHAGAADTCLTRRRSFTLGHSWMTAMQPTFRWQCLNHPGRAGVADTCLIPEVLFAMEKLIDCNTASHT